MSDVNGGLSAGECARTDVERGAVRRPARSRYLRSGKDNALIRTLVARALLASDLDEIVCYGGIDRELIRPFSLAGARRELLEDAGQLAEWLACSADEERPIVLAEDDPLSRNTRALARLVGAGAVEADVLALALLLARTPALDRACDAVGVQLGEDEAITLVGRLLGRPADAVAVAFDPEGPLRRAGLLGTRIRGAGAGLDSWLAVPFGVLERAFGGGESVERLLAGDFAPAPPATLTLASYGHLERPVSLAVELLRSAVEAGARGVNLLLWGPPGTGKTALARALGEALEVPCFEIGALDADGDGLPSIARLASYRLAQGLLAGPDAALVLFDETEDILCDASYAEHGYRRPGQLTKALVNHTLETNPVPAIWITNAHEGIDAAFLRRFELVLEVPAPQGEARRRVIDGVLGASSLGSPMRARLERCHAVSPAHLEKVRRVLERLDVDSAERADAVVETIVEGDLRVGGAGPLAHHHASREPCALPWNGALMRVDIDLERVVERLGPGTALRLCLGGPPGSGKSAWARELARRSGRELLRLDASDLLDMYVGETEKRIARAFHVAERDGAVLLIDEVDTFLCTRSPAEQRHYAQTTNQFLVSLEAYAGVFVATTNRLDVLDRAARRRFDLTARCRTLDAAGVRVLLGLLAERIAPETNARTLDEAAKALAGCEIVAGDGQVVLRRHAALGEPATFAHLVEALEREARARGAGHARGIGFLAAPVHAARTTREVAAVGVAGARR